MASSNAGTPSLDLATGTPPMPASTTPEGDQGQEGPRGGWPSVSVIVPLFNEGENVRSLVEALKTQEYPGSVELLLVDNASTDDTVAILEGLDVDVLEEPAPGSYVARNRGIQNAGGDVLAFTDGDCRPLPGWLREAVGCLDRSGADLVAGRVDRPPSPGWNLWAAYDAAMYLRQGYYVTLGRAATANLVARADVFEAVGSFPEVRSGGDFAWTAKATSQGYRLSYCEGAIVHHPPHRTFQEVFSKEARFVRENGVLRSLSSIHQEDVTGKVLADQDASLRAIASIVALLFVKNVLKFLAIPWVLLRPKP